MHGRVPTDAASFSLRDAVGVSCCHRRAHEGALRLVRVRSAIHRPRPNEFPENTEMEAALTFASDDPGGEIRRHTPDGRPLTPRKREKSGGPSRRDW